MHLFKYSVSPFSVVLFLFQFSSLVLLFLLKESLSLYIIRLPLSECLLPIKVALRLFSSSAVVPLM